METYSSEDNSEQSRELSPIIEAEYIESPSNPLHRIFSCLYPPLISGVEEKDDRQQTGGLTAYCTDIVRRRSIFTEATAKEDSIESRSSSDLQFDEAEIGESSERNGIINEIFSIEHCGFFNNRITPTEPHSVTVETCSYPKSDYLLSDVPVSIIPKTGTKQRLTTSNENEAEPPSVEDVMAFFDIQSSLMLKYIADERGFAAARCLNELEESLRCCLQRFCYSRLPTEEGNNLQEKLQYYIDKIKSDNAIKQIRLNLSVANFLFESFHLDYMRHVINEITWTDLSNSWRIKDVLLSDLQLHYENSFMLSASQALMHMSSGDEGVESNAEKVFKSPKKRQFSLKKPFGKRVFRKFGSKRNHAHSTKQNDNDGWIRDGGKFMDLAYRSEKNLSVSVKVRGKLPCPLLQILAILNETDLAENWAPLLTSAKMECRIGKAVSHNAKINSLIIENGKNPCLFVVHPQQVYDYPILGQKESISYCFGVNALEEFGCVIVFCTQPSEEEILQLNCEMPHKKSKLTRVRAADLCFLLHPRKRGNYTMLEMYANFQHNIAFIPSRMIAFVVKRLVKSMFVSIAKLSKAFENSVYAQRVKSRPEFYAWMSDYLQKFYSKEQNEFLKCSENVSLTSFDDVTAIE
ncbi:hypothetical protein IE077_004133 [Cardiosporidium cionae]|uniref:START domain-containing protein n=1 Tax=Cardiosporidium cionae TaxID=476202 RepID=A0ABQ7J6Q1_9APIC|nr:hypothetical protein IE077_004133 [Cardiosporidium cionae]|eukprot:KAF8819677.1 hypothetical protein IE077_004133 [Cardiosporidium cionae]